MSGEDGYEIWKRALTNVTPAIEVRSRRIGGATFQIPAEVRTDRKVSLSIKWLIRFSRDRNGRSMAEKLANEIVAASKGEGAAYKKKEDTHRMADANKVNKWKDIMKDKILAPTTASFLDIVGLTQALKEQDTP